MVYIIKSESYRLLKNKINELTKEVLKDNIEYYDLIEDNLYSILEGTRYNSLFDDKKAIIINNANIFDTKSDNKYDFDLIEDYFKSNNIIIFISDGFNLKNKFVKYTEDNGGLIEIIKPKGEEVNKYIKDYLKIIDYNIDTYALIELIKRCDNNIDYILNELDKLLIVKTNNNISKEDIVKYVYDNSNIDLFEFTDLIIKKDIDKALLNLDNIIKQDIEPAVIFSTIANQYRLILSVKNLIKTKSEKNIANMFGIHPYRVKLAHDNSYNYTNQELINNLLYIGEIDTKIKTSGMDKYNALKLFLINIK